MKRHKSLKNILALNFVLVSIIPILVLGISTLNLISASLTEEISAKNLSLAKALAGEVETFLNEPLSLLRQVVDITQRKKLIAPEQFRDYLASVMGSYGAFDMIQILDDKGEIIFVTPHDPEFIGTNMSGQPFYRDAAGSGTPRWSPTFISMQTGQPTLTLSIATGSRMVVGYLNLNILGKMTGKLRSGRYGNAIITDQRGTVISHVKRRLVSQRWSLKNLKLVREGLAGREGTFLEETENGKIIGSIAIVPQTGWLVIFYQQTREAFRPVAKIRLVFLAAALLTAIMAVILSLASLKKTLTPLNRLIINAKKVGSGDYGGHLPAGGYSEIEALSKNFDLMTQAVRKREEELTERIRLLALGAAVGQALASEARLDTMLERCTGALVEHVGACMARIWLLNAPHGFLELVAGSGILPFGEEEVRRIPLGPSGIGAIGLSRKSIHSNLLAQGEGHLPPSWAEGENLVAFSGTPLIVGDRLVGVVAFFSRTPISKTTHDAMDSLSDLIALGIDRKETENALQLFNAELDQRVRTRTAELETSIESLRATQKQLVESEKMASLGGLVAGIAHEINTPLGIGITNTSFIEVSGRKIGKLYAAGRMKRSEFEAFLQGTKESARAALLNLNKAAELVASFKQVSVDQTIEIKRHFDIRAYVEEIILSLRPECRRQGHIITFFAPEALVIDSYPGVLMQIITNLVTNSLIHGFDKTENGEMTIDISAADQEVKIRYEDNGRGMSKEESESVFEPFFTTRRGKGGTGLGMHIVYNLVTQKLAGRIRCVRKKSGGTAFAIAFPTTSPPEHARQPAPGVIHRPAGD